MTTPTTSQHPYGTGYGGTAPENYERYFIPVIGGPLAADLVAEAAPRPGERVLDVACGTGIIARRAAERVGATGSVDALDVNPGMLAVARVVASRTDPAIRWYETAAESMPLPDDAFDVVFCQLGLMFMADKAAALREMRRVLATGGRVAVSVPTPTPFFDVLEQAFARHLPAGAPFVRMVFSLDDTAEIERLFNDAGFRHVLVRPVRKEMHLPPPREFLWQYVQSTPLATLAAEADPSVLAMLEHDVVAGWQPWAREGGMTYRQDLVVTTARK